MNVLHVISGMDPRLGGPSAAMVGLLAAQRRAGLAVSLLTTWSAAFDDLSLARQVASAGSAVRTIGPVGRPLGRHRELREAVGAAVAEADVVHIHALWEQAQHEAARAARRAGRPYVFRPCGMLDPWSLRQNRLVKKLYLWWRLRRDLDGAAALHFTSATERDVTGRLRLRAAAIVEPNGVALEEFAALPARGTFRRRYPAIGSRPLVVFLSRLHPKKGLDLLLPAFARCGVAEAMLALVGPVDDAYRVQLEATARARGVGDRVIFAGMLRGADRVAALADADVFCLPSYQENFGIAVVEALAAGVPVVISDQVNIHGEIAAAGVGGVAPTRVEPLAAELRRWLTDPPLRDDAAAKCRAFVWERYDWNAIARRWVEHYGRMLKGSESGT